MDDVNEKKDEIVLKAKVLSIVDDKTYRLACHLLIEIDQLQKEIDRTFDPVIKAAHDSHKAALNAKNDHALPLKNAKEHLLVMKNRYDRMLKEKAEAEERRKKEEAERERKAREKEEEERRLQAALEKEEEARKLREAQKEEEAKKLEAEAAKIIEAPPTPPPPSPPPAPLAANTPFVFGVRTVLKPWEWEVVNPDLVPREYLTIDAAAITKVVRLFKDKTNIAGIRVFQDSTTRIG